MKNINRWAKKRLSDVFFYVYQPYQSIRSLWNPSFQKLKCHDLQLNVLLDFDFLARDRLPIWHIFYLT